MTDQHREKPKEQSEWLKKIMDIPACKECGLIAGKCLLESYGKECKKESVRIPEWDASLTYRAGDEVMYNGVEIIMGDTIGTIKNEKD